MSVTETLLAAPWVYAVLLGLWFGLVHALDADHLATIGGLAVNSRSASATQYAARWALGHALSLCLIASLVLGLGLWGLAALAEWAELLVAAVLLAIGTHALRGAYAQWRNTDVLSLADQSTQATCNATDPIPAERTSAAMSASVAPPGDGSAAAPGSKSVGRAGIWMGALHGGAGSAAVLALIPLTSFQSGLQSSVYLLCFCAGVAVGALAFSRVFATLCIRTARAGLYAGALWRGAIGAIAITVGAWLLLEVIGG